MSRSAEIIFTWGDAERTFRLGIKELDRLQERCGERGPKRLLTDLFSGDWKVRDVVETLRLGLYGGGMKAPEADKLIREYVEERPLEENIIAAVVVLQAALVGPPLTGEKAGDDPPGKTKAAMTGSTSPPSTGMEPPSAGARSTPVH